MPLWFCVAVPEAGSDTLQPEQSASHLWLPHWYGCCPIRGNSGKHHRRLGISSSWKRWCLLVRERLWHAAVFIYLPVLDCFICAVSVPFVRSHAAGLRAPRYATRARCAGRGEGGGGGGGGGRRPTIARDDIDAVVLGQPACNIDLLLNVKALQWMAWMSLRRSVPTEEVPLVVCRACPLLARVA